MPNAPSPGTNNMRALGAVPLDIMLNPHIFTTTTVANSASIGENGLRFTATSRVDIHLTPMSPWNLPAGLYENKGSPYGSYLYKPSTNLALVVINAAAAVIEGGITFYVHGKNGIVTFQELSLIHI